MNKNIVTKNVVLELLKESDLQRIKDEVIARLWRGRVTIVFTKVDGTERTMIATLDPTLMIDQPVPPAEPDVESTETDVKKPRRPRPDNPSVRTFYDTETNTWKSFRWASLISYSYNIGEYV